jgi:hypothetical protein
MFLYGIIVPTRPFADISVMRFRDESRLFSSLFARLSPAPQAEELKSVRKFQESGSYKVTLLESLFHS